MAGERFMAIPLLSQTMSRRPEKTGARGDRIPAVAHGWGGCRIWLAGVGDRRRLVQVTGLDTGPVEFNGGGNATSIACNRLVPTASTPVVPTPKPARLVPAGITPTAFHRSSDRRSLRLLTAGQP
jgi:hypothetical protein